MIGRIHQCGHAWWPTIYWQCISHYLEITFTNWLVLSITQVTIAVQLNPSTGIVLMACCLITTILEQWMATNSILRENLSQFISTVNNLSDQSCRNAFIDQGSIGGLFMPDWNHPWTIYGHKFNPFQNMAFSECHIYCFFFIFNLYTSSALIKH